MKLKRKILKLSDVAFLTNIEIGLLFLKTLLIVLLVSTSLFLEGIRSVTILLVTIIIFIQLFIFYSRHKKIFYSGKYKSYIIVSFLQIFLFISFIFSLYRMQSLNLYIEIIGICWLICLFIMSYINFSFPLKMLFYWRLKSVFPFEGKEKQSLEFSLKKLSPYISIEKQKAYFIISYGTRTIFYGFYFYLCLVILKNANFTAIPQFADMQFYLINMSFINTSNTIGLLSIFIALLTLAVPAQQKIVREAEENLMKRFKRNDK